MNNIHKPSNSELSACLLSISSNSAYRGITFLQNISRFLTDYMESKSNTKNVDSNEEFFKVATQ